MAYNEAQKRATMKYMAEKLDEVRFRVPKGRKEQIASHAVKQGESMAAFLTRAVDETMQRDNKTAE